MSKRGASAEKVPPAIYQAGLVLVSLAMVVLPCIYVALTAFAGYGVYYYAVNYFPGIWEWPVGGQGGLVAIRKSKIAVITNASRFPYN